MTLQPFAPLTTRKRRLARIQLFQEAHVDKYLVFCKKGLDHLSWSGLLIASVKLRCFISATPPADAASRTAMTLRGLCKATCVEVGNIVSVSLEPLLWDRRGAIGG